MVRVHPVHIAGEDDVLKDVSRSPTSGRILEIVETSPCGRFARFNKCTNVSNLLIQYLGYDSEEGLEVTWNVLMLSELKGSKLPDQMLRELEKLKTVDHPNVAHVDGVWLSENNTALVYTTDLPTSRTLKHFIRYYPITLSVLKRWCSSILMGLKYLHEVHKPQIVHGNITCDNIYINGTTGKIRIGGLEWSCVQPLADILCTKGTERDIAAFGLSIMDIVLRCTNLSLPIEEFEDSLNSGKPPSVFGKFVDSPFKSFISRCIIERKPASVLLKDSFLAETEEELHMEKGIELKVLYRELSSA